MKAKPSVYLAGGMEQADELGAEWRDAITPFLDELGFDVLDPTKLEPLQLKGLRPTCLPATILLESGEQTSINHWHELLDSYDLKQYKRGQKYMRNIIRYDMNVVRNEADYIIAYWDQAAAEGAGTHAEITEAFLNNKPVYMVEAQDPPKWLRGCCSERFKTWAGLYGFLAQEFGED
jgi:hypothetical protein